MLDSLLNHGRAAIAFLQKLPPPSMKVRRASGRRFGHKLYA